MFSVRLSEYYCTVLLLLFIFHCCTIPLVGLVGLFDSAAPVQSLCSRKNNRELLLPDLPCRGLTSHHFTKAQMHVRRIFHISLHFYFINKYILLIAIQCSFFFFSFLLCDCCCCFSAVGGASFYFLSPRLFYIFVLISLPRSGSALFIFTAIGSNNPVTQFKYLKEGRSRVPRVIGLARSIGFSRICAPLLSLNSSTVDSNQVT